MALVAGLAVPLAVVGLVDSRAVAAPQEDGGDLLPIPELGADPTSPTRTPPPSSPLPSSSPTSAKPRPPKSSATSPSTTPTSPGGEPPSETSSAPPPPPSSEQPKPSLPPASGVPSDVQPGPGRVWTLTASELTLKGVRYHGFEMKEVAGKQVRTMHFTVDELRITDLVQRGRLGNGKVVKAAAAPGSVSTVTDGPIQLYTRKLTGTLNVAGYPAIPITMSPESFLLPNVDLSFLKLPKLTFSDAVVRNVALLGGKLHIPGASITLE